MLAFGTTSPVSIFYECAFRCLVLIRYRRMLIPCASTVVHFAMSKIMADHSVEGDRPSSKESTNPWSTSATLPVSQEAEDVNPSPKSAVSHAVQGEKASPTPWSTSATLPVSPESETQDVPSEPPVPPAVESKPAAKPAKKKPFSTAEHKTAFLHFLRIFSYSTWTDKLLLFAASLASICTGITLPLMNVVFGKSLNQINDLLLITLQASLWALSVHCTTLGQERQKLCSFTR